MVEAWKQRFVKVRRLSAGASTRVIVIKHAGELGEGRSCHNYSRRSTLHAAAPYLISRKR